MSIELILLSVNINFIAFSAYINDISGQIFAMLTLTVAAAEAAIGLAILVVFFRNLGSIEVNKINLGAGYSRNKGIKKSKTKYVAFLDSDDLWVKDKLKIQINHMEKNNYVFSHTSYYVINDKDKVISIRNARSNITFDELLRSCDIGLSTVILNTKFIKKK